MFHWSSRIWNNLVWDSSFVSLRVLPLCFCVLKALLYHLLKYGQLCISQDRNFLMMESTNGAFLRYSCLYEKNCWIFLNFLSTHSIFKYFFKLISDEVKNPCEPSPCGPNAECTQRNGVGSCSCIQDYTGNPYEGCRPECVLSSDCPTNKACVRNKCEDPCPGVCGQNAQCSVINHIPTCTCVEGYVGNPFVVCSIPPPPGNVDRK